MLLLSSERKPGKMHDMSQDYREFLKRPSILIIDDEPSNLHVLSEILKGSHKIIFSMSGDDGLRVAETHHPDLILLDVDMPHMNGFATCVQLKENQALKDIPVIFVTMMGALDDEVKGFEVGAVDYITKPINAATVVKRVQNHLRIKEHWNALQDMIVVDSLTGVANRRGFDVALDREWRRAIRKHSAFSLLMADIDHFKAYNDRYGHTAGDICLRTVAQVFEKQVKHMGGLVARYGGEELVCLLSDACAEDASQIAQRLLADLRTVAIPHEASPVAPVVTVSLGVATTVAHAGVSPNDLLDLADRLLYQAKQTGKNRFITGMLTTLTHKNRGRCCLNATQQMQSTLVPVADWRRELWNLEGTTRRPAILIIDNEPSQIEVLVNLLGGDYHILSALSGAEGLRIAEAQALDLILLDVMMPHVNGFEVCKQFRDDPFLADIPIIFVTGMATVFDEVKGFEVGAVDYITRPFQPPVVHNRVRNHLELKMQRDILRRLATTDGLTGIANRRGFDETLAREWLRSSRNQTQISLIISDIDYFKQYNDRYGHVAGDDCLRTIAGIFQCQVQRPGDLAARYGGEEFVCLLPDTDSIGATQVAQRLQASVEGCAIPHQASAIADVITLSFGVATTVARVDCDPRTLLTMADGLLYEAKNTGRNRMNVDLFTCSDQPQLTPIPNLR